MTRSKDIGTRAETAVVRYLRTDGFPHAERRALTGTLDQGDITGCPGICWEVKARNRPPSDTQIVVWLAETETERVNARADLGILVVRRAGVGAANAGRWWAVMTVPALHTLIAVPHRYDHPALPITMLLADAVHLLRAAGYGDPLTAEHVTGEAVR